MGFLAAWAAVRAFLPKVPWQVWLALGLVVGGVVSALYIHHQGYEQGKLEALDTVKEANDASEARADRGSQDVDKCYRDGGTWDRARGVCHIGSPRQ